jgi:hypothetical protein
MELSVHVVDFEKRSAMKSQILADFVVEWMEPGSEILADFVVEWMEPGSEIEGAEPESPWLVYCDEAWGQQGLVQLPY